jgi:hypothetical protein
MGDKTQLPASHVQVGQWIIQRAGSYRVDGITVRGGLAYIGTKHGVLVLPADSLVLIAGNGDD